MVLNINSILVGKFLFGFTSGVINIAAPKMLDETVPTYMLKVFGLATNAYICLGITLAMVIGFGFPNENDLEAMKVDEFWRVVFGLPIIFCILQLFTLFSILKNDSILYHIKLGQDDKAKEVISQVYDKNEI